MNNQLYLDRQRKALIDTKALNRGKGDKPRFGVWSELVATSPFPHEFGCQRVNRLHHQSGVFAFDRPTHDSQRGNAVPACQKSGMQCEALTRSEWKPKRFCGHIRDSTSSIRMMNWNDKRALHTNWLAWEGPLADRLIGVPMGLNDNYTMEE